MQPLVEFRKIVAEGKAMGYWEGRACFCLGPLPGETARVTVVKQTPSYTEAMLGEITVPRPERGAPAEDHWLACSPWQGVAYEYQLALKRQMLSEIMSHPELRLPVHEVVGAPVALAYRNKLEFAWGPGLALHDRGSRTVLVPAPAGCRLGSDAMNLVAQELAERLRLAQVAGVRSVMVRQSRLTGEVVAVVGLERPVRADWAAVRPGAAVGVAAVVNRPGQPWREIGASGQMVLREQVNGLELEYPYDGFFQVNVAAFEVALARVLAAVPEGTRLADVYGGVGVIGLAAAHRVERVLGVEVSRRATELAQANAARLGLAGYEARCLGAEGLVAADLVGYQTVVVDPPRAGLHLRVVERLLEVRPERIIYLSCNPVTQARDLRRLRAHYVATSVTGFDFYPGTPHLEALAVLDRA